jgi:hypothetical protein
MAAGGDVVSETRFPKSLAEKVLHLTDGQPEMQQALGLVEYQGWDTRRASTTKPTPALRVPVFVSDEEWVETPLPRDGGRL